MADLPEPLFAYLAARDAQRAEAVDAVLASLTERERRLVREAAVMGYVRGRRHPAGQDHPKDSAVLAEVVDACLAAPDLYPVISGVRPCGECSHPEYAHRGGDDPVTPGTCGACALDDPDEARHDYRVGAAS
jgi:hypothetical protein